MGTMFRRSRLVISRFKISEREHLRRSNEFRKVSILSIKKIIILYKDRLLRFGFEILENLCKKYGTIIEIIDNAEKTEDQELFSSNHHSF